ncbi:hypothetical protein C8Q75DRAFT_803892 [Abortiporus biennis]|nr:hypothetical protein C8Q75DRAFT_803892 [Abortiporus biennis]
MRAMSQIASDQNDKTATRFHPFHHPDRRTCPPPSLKTGYIILFCTTLFFLVGSYAIFFSAFLPEIPLEPFHILAKDTHYKYFVLLLIPTGAYFVIANWVGWQYYRNT